LNLSIKKAEALEISEKLNSHSHKRKLPESINKQNCKKHKPRRSVSAPL